MLSNLITRSVKLQQLFVQGVTNMHLRSQTKMFCFPFQNTNRATNSVKHCSMGLSVMFSMRARVVYYYRKGVVTVLLHTDNSSVWFQNFVAMNLIHSATPLDKYVVFVVRIATAFFHNKVGKCK